MADHDVTTRTCTRCAVSKTLDAYYVVKSGRQKGSLYTVCKACKNAQGAKWAENNREKCVEYVQKWRSQNLEASRKITRDHAIRNKDAYAARSKQWRLDNPDRHRELFTRWVENNPDRYKASLKTRGQRYRARRLAAQGEFTAEQIKDMHAKQRGKCPVCREKLDVFHIDHVVALSRGGSNDISNIQLLCKPCNLKKHAKDPIQFMQEQGFLL